MGRCVHRRSSLVARAILLLLLLSPLSVRAEETIYHLETSFNLYGEAYHLLLALAFDPKAYVHLPEYSGIEDPKRHSEQLKEELQRAEQQLRARETELDSIIKELSEKAARNRGEERSKPYHISELVMNYLALGLTEQEKTRAFTAFEEEARAEKTVSRWKARIDSAERSFRIAEFLRQAGLKDQILTQKLSDEPTRGVTVEPLKGKLLPGKLGAEGKVFQNPTFSRLQNQLDAFAKTSRAEREAKLASLKKRILSSENQVPSDLQQYIKTNFESALPQGRKAILLWNRGGNFEAWRNMDEDLLLEMIAKARKSGAVPFILGDPIRTSWDRVRNLIRQGKAIPFTEHWKDAPFSESATTFQKQLWFFDELMKRDLIVGQMGMMSGVMDGPAILSGVPTVIVAKGRIPHATDRAILLGETLPNYDLVHIKEGVSFYSFNRDEALALCNEMYQKLGAQNGQAGH